MSPELKLLLRVYDSQDIEAREDYLFMATLRRLIVEAAACCKSGDTDAPPPGWDSVRIKLAEEARQ
jgi:hypothetical protein